MDEHKCKICDKICKSSLSLSKHINNFHKMSKESYLLQYEYNGVRPKCACGCGKETNFTGGVFSKYINGHVKITEETLKKRFATNLKKYGYKSPAKNDKVKEKTKKYFIDKYGVENPWQAEEIKEKIKETNLEKYGVEYSFQSEEVKEKTKQTKLKKYGDKNYNNREKLKQTSIDKYGVDNPSKTIDIKNKIKQTNQKRYGANSFTQTEKGKNKIKNKLLKTFYNRIKNKLDDVEILSPLENYTGVKLNQKYKFQCKKCNNIFYDRLDDGHIPRCKKCNPINYQQSQNEIHDFVKSIYSGKIIQNDRSLFSGKIELDIYIPDKKLAIEYDGLYWHSEIGGDKDKNYHLNKTLKCKEKDIRLLHIFEDEWLNKQEIVKNKLRNIFGLSPTKIYGRQCNIKEISSTKKNDFLNEYHIQGGDKSKIKLGLFHKKELVGIMTFGNRRISLGKKETKKGEYELIRFASSVNVVGGAGKLLSHFIKNYNPEKIVSYADRRWSIGNLYEKLGFNKVKETLPNYWYVKNGYFERIHRFNFRKNVLNEKLETFNSELTEWENMQLNGYDRIWDCGNLKYEWNNYI